MFRSVVLVGAIVLGFLIAAPLAAAAPPTITGVGQQDGHAWASWSLPAGVEATVVEVATSPATGTDGYFFYENVVDFATVEATQTYWLSTYKRAPGTYYVHVGGIDDPCFMADLCPVREFSTILELTIPAEPPPPVTTTTETVANPPAHTPKYAVKLTPASLRPKQKVKAMFRDAAPGGERVTYRVCWRQGTRTGCAKRSINGSAWDTWRVKVGKSAKRIYFTWKVSGKIVKTRSAKVKLR